MPKTPSFLQGISMFLSESLFAPILHILCGFLKMSQDACKMIYIFGARIRYSGAFQRVFVDFHETLCFVL